MSDALSLEDAIVTEQLDAVRYTHADPWLARRARRMGASDVPALLLAYDTRPEEVATARAYHREGARVVQTRRGPLPLVIARKAGLRKPQAESTVMRRGQKREVELLRRWSVGAREILEGSLVVAERMTPWTRHPIDHDCDALAATLDGYAVDLFGEWVIVEAKCPRDAPESLPWYWRAQMQAQMAAAGVGLNVAVIGPGWGASDDGGGEPLSWMVERADDEIARIREVCRRGAADLARAMEDA